MQRRNRERETPIMARRLGLLGFALALNAVLIAAPLSTATAGPLDGYNDCNRRFGRANDQNKKDVDAVAARIKKANNAAMVKSDPVKYCDWHTKNVLPTWVKIINRMEGVASDKQCFNDPLAVDNLERHVRILKADQRWLSSLCLGVKDE